MGGPRKKNVRGAFQLSFFNNICRENIIQSKVLAGGVGSSKYKAVVPCRGSGLDVGQWMPCL